MHGCVAVFAYSLAAVRFVGPLSSTDSVMLMAACASLESFGAANSEHCRNHVRQPLRAPAQFSLRRFFELRSLKSALPQLDTSSPPRRYLFAFKRCPCVETM